MDLVSQYDYGWMDGCLAAQRNSKTLSLAHNQAKHEIAAAESPFKSREDFQAFLGRWRGGPSTGITATAPLPAEASQFRLQAPPLDIHLISDPRIRKEYEEWCQELDDHLIAQSLDQTSEQVLEGAITKIKLSMEQVEVLSVLALDATDEQRNAILRLKEDMKATKQQELQDLESELQTFFKDAREKERRIQELKKNKHAYIAHARSCLEELETIVAHVRQLPQL